VIVRSLAALILLALLSSCRSTPPPGAPRNDARRLITPVARVPMN
jgi:hypothetical protein